MQSRQLVDILKRNRTRSGHFREGTRLYSRSLHRLAGTALLATLIVVSGGCGLTDYEARLESQEKKLKYIEDENQNLERDVTFPDEDKEDFTSVFYFRPPKGIRTEPEAKMLGKHFYVFPSQRADSGFKDVLIAVAEEGKTTPAKFQKEIKDFLEIKGPASTREYSRPKGMLNSFPQRYDVYQERGIILCFLQEPSFPTAIVFRLSGPASPITDDRIKFSLASLLEGKPVAAQRKIARGSTKKAASTKKGPGIK
jgi:hypothetical protein